MQISFPHVSNVMIGAKDHLPIVIMYDFDFSSMQIRTK